MAGPHNPWVVKNNIALICKSRPQQNILKKFPLQFAEASF